MELNITDAGEDLGTKVPLSTHATDNDIPALNGHSYNIKSNIIHLNITKMCSSDKELN